MNNDLKNAVAHFNNDLNGLNIETLIRTANNVIKNLNKCMNLRDQKECKITLISDSDLSSKEFEFTFNYTQNNWLSVDVKLKAPLAYKFEDEVSFSDFRDGLVLKIETSALKSDI